MRTNPIGGSTVLTGKKNVKGCKSSRAQLNLVDIFINRFNSHLPTSWTTGGSRETTLKDVHPDRAATQKNVLHRITLWTSFCTLKSGKGGRYQGLEKNERGRVRLYSSADGVFDFSIDLFIHFLEFDRNTNTTAVLKEWIGHKMISLNDLLVNGTD